MPGGVAGAQSIMIAPYADSNADCNFISQHLLQRPYFNHLSTVFVYSPDALFR